MFKFVYKKRSWLIGCIILSLSLLLQSSPLTAQQPQVTLTRIATNLHNPRGVAVLPDGHLIVAEAGTGIPGENQGRLSIFEDLNADGDYDDAGEIIPIIENLPSYNAYVHFNPGRDEVLGIGDIVLKDDRRILYTLDNNFEELSIFEVLPSWQLSQQITSSAGTMNALAYDPQKDLLYVAESSLNLVSIVDAEGTRELLAPIPMLDSEQQSVPAGLAIDPLTGNILVALFSGQLFSYYGNILSYMTGDAKIIRINPETGSITDEITGLTTAIDVAIDEIGNIYVVEMSTRWAPPPLYRPFDLYDPNSPPDDGGYSRFSGRVSLYPADGSTPIRLAENLDTPTNITYHDHTLYISTGQGTPGRMIFGPYGKVPITGELYQIQLP